MTVKNFLIKISTTFVFIALISTSFFTENTLYAQTGGEAVDARKAALEAELAEIEREIEAQQVVLRDKQREKVSLERDVAILDAQISEARLSIRARDLVIEKLGSEINVKNGVIGSLSEKLEREKESLSQILRKTNKIDSLSLVEMVLSNEDLSDFFVDLDSFNAIEESLKESFGEIENTKVKTEDEKDALEEKKLEEVELRALQELQKRRIEDKRRERNNILDVTKGQEAVYQKIINAKERDAASIRSELFMLRGTAAIPFGEALELANTAFSKTGVRPALILAIIAEESNLGENVGTGSWKVDMKDPRDTVPFLEITKRLGLDPDQMPVSKKPWYGWGGAMGPAQFIPSTWVLYEDRIGQLTGHNPPNPWNPEDAFMACAVLLKDNGAAKGGYSAERLAALRYFAGWKNATKSSYAFYGDDVMELATKYQKQIDILQSN